MKRYVRPPVELLGRLQQKLFTLCEISAPSIFLRPTTPTGSAVNIQLILNRNDRQLLKAALPPGAGGRILEYSQAILEGEVEIFGLGRVNVGSPPRWNHEPIADIVSPMVHWSRVRYLDSSVVGDHKILWEFNRHQYLITLAQAWVVSGNDEWAELLASHVTDWIAKNPAGIGPNWASSLEVAYRAIAWCWVIRLAVHAPAVEAVLPLLTRSIADHARHISRYLSTWFSPNTHLTGEALGLLYIGTFFPGLHKAQEWAFLGEEVLLAQLTRQVHTDGVYFEQATQYHRYTAEIYLHMLLLMKWRGETVDTAIHARVVALFDVLLHLSRPDGTMALLGDDDGGHLLPLDGSAPDELKGLLAAAGSFLQAPALQSSGGDDIEMSLWLFGAQKGDPGPPTPPQLPRFRCFAQGGLITMRDSWQRNAGHATIDCGPHGSLSRGHSHADALSVVLHTGGKPLFVDSGTYTYVGVERNQFRGGLAHNAVTLSGTGSGVPAEMPFRWLSFSDAAIRAFESCGDVAWFEGAVSGVGSSPANIHCRSVLHPGAGIWVISDDMVTEEAEEIVVSWHLHPEVSAEKVEGGQGPSYSTVHFMRAGRVVATAAVIGVASGNATMSQTPVSSRFGAKEASRVLRWGSTANGYSAVVTIVIDWELVLEGEVRVERGGDLIATLVNPVPSSSRKIRINWVQLQSKSTPMSRSHTTVKYITDNVVTRTVKAGPGIHVQDGDTP